jgi:hypothetical protein
VLIPLLGVLLLSRGTLRCEEAEPAAETISVEKALTADWLIEALRTKADRELLHVLKVIAFSPKLPRFHEAELKTLTRQAERIREQDPAVEEFNTPRGIREIHHPNRVAAIPALARLNCQRLVNPLYALSMKERVNKLIDYIEEPPLPAYELTVEFTHELVHAGKEGVPFIVQRTPKDLQHRSALVYALGRIGDPKGVDYLIKALKTPGQESIYLRGKAAKALAGFKDEKAIQALIEALKDETFVEVEKRLPPPPGPNPKSFPSKYLLLQHEASDALTAITGQHWGFLYNEDYKTWAEWERQGRPKDFKPLEVQRTDDELARIVEKLFHRYMAGRPEKPGPEILLGNTDGDMALAGELRALGKRSVELLVAQCSVRVRESPQWEAELKRWTRHLLTYLDWPEAQKAMEALNGAAHE